MTSKCVKHRTFVIIFHFSIHISLLFFLSYSDNQAFPLCQAGYHFQPTLQVKCIYSVIFYVLLHVAPGGSWFPIWGKLTINPVRLKEDKVKGRLGLKFISHGSVSAPMGFCSEPWMLHSPSLPACFTHPCSAPPPSCLSYVTKLPLASCCTLPFLPALLGGTPWVGPW